MNEIIKPLCHIDLPKKLPATTNPTKIPATNLHPNGYAYASNGRLYKSAFFGRDAAEVALDLLATHPELALSTIKALAALQGQKTNRKSQEEPGKIHHEYRSLKFMTLEDRNNPESLPRHILAKLGQNFGTTPDNEICYYGSIDSTPLFLWLAAAYCLQEKINPAKIIFNHQTKGRQTLKESIELATKWLLTKLINSPSGLLEFKSTNPRGLINQAWMDSEEAYVHPDGSEVNHDSPLAATEVQGYAYQALITTAKLAQTTNNQLETDKLSAVAENLRQRVFSLLWLKEKNYFATGVDYDPMTNQARTIDILTANPATLLETDIFKNLSEDEVNRYVGGIVNNIFRPDLITSVGVRCRSLKHADIYADFYDYHGSYVTWPKQTYDICRGLDNYGLHSLADNLARRLELLRYASGNLYPEFVYVESDGTILVHTSQIKDWICPKSNNTVAPRLIHTRNIPENHQSWTYSAYIGLGARPTLPTSGRWQKTLEQAIIPITKIPEYITITTFENDSTFNRLYAV